VKPTLLFAVPMLLNKVYDQVMNGIAQQSPFRQKLVKAAFKISRQRNHLLEFHQPVPALLEWKFKMCDKIIFSKIRDRLGGRLRYMGSGGAAASMPVLHFFEDIGIPVCEGYGLTETAPIITSSGNGWETRRLGCVGVPVPGAEILILDPQTLQDMPPGIDGEVRSLSIVVSLQCLSKR
jgi:long-chain acyl-CoA synthetase